MATLKIWFEATRPKTLPAAVSPVLLGSGAAHAEGGLVWSAALICLLFALLVQIGTNFANDYLDGIKGTDTDARLGPVRAVASGLIPSQTMKRMSIGTLAVAFVVGLGLIPFGGVGLLLVGMASVTCAWLYTGGPFPLAYNGLGDVFVVLFFGFVAVGCTYFVQVGEITGDIIWLGLGCGLLVNNILIVNNYRDVDEDLVAAKRTLVVIFGRRFAQVLYFLSAIVAGGVVFRFWNAGYGDLVLFALIPVVGSLLLAIRLSSAETPDAFLQALKGAGIVVAAYGALFTIGLST